MPEDVAVATEAPAAPVDTGTAPPAAPAAPAAPADASKVYEQTDEQILGIEPVGAKPAEAPAEEQKPPEQAPDAAAAAIAEDGRLMPVKWRELAKSDPDFRTLFYEHRSIKEKLGQMEPKLAEFQAASESIAKADAAYLSGDPNAIQTELSGFVAEKPDALIPMLEAGEQLIQKMLPEKYKDILHTRFTEGLKTYGFGNVFQLIREQRLAGEGGTGELGKQLDLLLDWAGKNGFPTTPEEMLAQKQADLDRREQAQQQAAERDYETQRTAFNSSVNTGLDEQLNTAIKDALKAPLEKAAFTDGVKARIAADIFKEIRLEMGKNQDMLVEVAKAIWPNGSKDGAGKTVRGIFNDSTKSSAIQIPLKFAKTVLNDVVKRVVEGYTKDFLAGNATRQEKVNAAAAKTEVSGGAEQPRPRKPLQPKDMDYSKMSDEDILAL